MNGQLVQRTKAHVMATPNVAIRRPVTKTDVEATEKALGFRLPELLTSIYTQVADGGLNPPNRSQMVSINHTDDGDAYTLVEQYRDHQAGAQYHGREWQTGLLPFWSWGCAIYSCVDCSDASLRIYQSEYCETERKSYNLEEFFEMWLNGVDILECDTGQRESAEIINPFTRKKTRVIGGRIKKTK
jgi:hypothetical protein